MHFRLPKLLLALLDVLYIGALVGNEFLRENLALVESLGAGLDSVLEVVKFGLEQQQVFVILAIIFGSSGLLLFLDPLLELAALQEVLVPVHTLHEALLPQSG